MLTPGAPGELERGTVFAGHRIEAVAGRGGMGVVYRATQLSLDRTVALKLVAPGLLADETIRRRFLRESRVAASIDHPNVIPIHYAGEEDGIAYLAMRYVGGDDLRSLVRREHRLPAARAARIVAQVGAGLDAAHAAGLVHRDVKPANVLLSDEDHVYVTDFGLTKHAASVGSETRPGRWVGTLDYAAPEQIRGERVDARADVYALGCLLYFTLTGEVPYPREGDEARLWAHLHDDPPHTGTAFDPIVARALAKAPADRYSSAGDLGRAALATAAGRPPDRDERLVAIGAAAPVESPTLTAARTGVTQARSEAKTHTPSPPVSRHRGYATPLAVGLAVALAGAAVVIALRRDGDGVAPAPQTVPTPAPTAVAAPAVRRSGPQAVATLRVGRRPNSLVATRDRVWVGSFGLPRLAAIHAGSDRRLRVAPPVGVGTVDLAVGYGTLWVAVGRARRLVRLDPRTGERRGRSIPLPAPPTAVATGRGSVWVSLFALSALEPDRLLRLDRATGAVQSDIRFAAGIRGIALSPGSVWLVNRRRGAVERLDARTGQVARTYEVGGTLKGIVYTRGAAWVTDQGRDRVVRIDATDHGIASVDVGGSPAGIAVAGTRLWVANSGDSTVTQIDARESRVMGDPVDVGLNPQAVGAHADGVWVTSVGDSTVTRLDRRGVRRADRARDE